LNLNAIKAKRKIAGGQLAGIIGGKETVILSSVAGEINRCFYPEAVGVRNFEAKFSGVALAQQWESKQEESDSDVEGSAQMPASGGISMVPAWRKEVGLRTE